ncbi:MAG: RNA polymerase sigma factor, partial [Bacteroidota bacterium]
LMAQLETVASQSPAGTFEIREHIDTCFTCLNKTLVIDQQVALLLKEVYDFSVGEIMLILGKSEGQVKYLLQNSRAILSEIFDRRCALVNQQGTCHQCSELNGWLNPKQDQQAARLKIKMVRAAKHQDQQALFRLRLALVKGIDPLRSSGNELQEALMNCNRMAMGEMEIP